MKTLAVFSLALVVFSCLSLCAFCGTGWNHVDIVEGLASEDVEVRRRAVSDYCVHMWRSSDPQAVPAVIHALEEDQDALVREQAACVLGTIAGPTPTPEAIRALTRALEGDKVARVRARAARVLGHHALREPGVMPALLQALQRDGSPDVRWAIVNTLSFVAREADADLIAMLEEEAVPVLIETLTDQFHEVRSEAAMTLGYIGSEAAVPALVERLVDRDSDVRQSAASALRRIGVDPIAALLQALEDEDPAVRADTVRALGIFWSEEEQVIPALTRALEDESSDVRLAAVWVLAEIGPRARQAVPALIRILEEDEVESVRERAAKALKSITGQDFETAAGWRRWWKTQQ